MHSPAFLVPRSLIFVSNRQKGLLEDGTVVSRFSTWLLLATFVRKYAQETQNPQLREHLYDATRAITEHEYNVTIQRMQDID